MKILAINPNTSSFVTDKVCAVAQAALGDRGTVSGVTGQSGPPIVGTRSECAMAAREALELAAQHADGYDAILLAISFDTGLDALREMLDIPVIGMSEAGMLAAMTCSRKFSMLTFGNRAVPLYEELVTYYGLDARSAGVLSLPPLTQEQLQDTSLVQPQIEEAIERAVAEDGTESVVLAGAVFAGLAEKLRSTVSVPVVDGIVAGTKLLEMQCALQTRKPAKGSLSAPPAKILTGSSEALTRLYKSF